MKGVVYYVMYVTEHTVVNWSGSRIGINNFNILESTLYGGFNYQTKNVTCFCATCAREQYTTISRSCRHIWMISNLTFGIYIQSKACV